LDKTERDLIIRRAAAVKELERVNAGQLPQETSIGLESLERDKHGQNSPIKIRIGSTKENGPEEFSTLAERVMRSYLNDALTRYRHALEDIVNGNA
jgi:hypothetical protein